MAGIAVVTGAGRGFGLEIARRLAGRGYEVLCTDIDEQAAASTAERVGGFSLALDVRDPEAHRGAARAAAKRGPLEVWVNNAGVARAAKAWEQPEDELRLLVEVNLLGVIHGSRAAIDAMRTGPAADRHIINVASLAGLTPVPGFAVYAATKHGVLGFTTSLQGDLRMTGIPITVHALCPDVADTEMVRERAGDEDSAILWSVPRFLRAEEVAERAVGLLDSEELVAVIPRWRGWAARGTAMLGRHAMRAAAPAHAYGRRRRERAR